MIVSVYTKTDTVIAVHTKCPVKYGVPRLALGDVYIRVWEWRVTPQRGCETEWYILSSPPPS